VDGGQSSTTAAIGDQTGRLIGFGRGGPCNHVGAAEGRVKFMNAISGCIAMACEQAGLDRSTVEFSSACLGFSGGPADKEAILREILRVQRMTVTTDAMVALLGATAGAPGIITIAGTGSIAYGLNADRKFARAGGWGYIFGDEGGGFDLTRQALRAALRHEEGWGPPTMLTEMLLAETGASDCNDLLHRFYTLEFPRPKIASYAKLVDRAEQEGDTVAHHLLLNAAQQLATTTSAVRHQLFREGERVKVAYVGGVFNSGVLLERFRLLVELEEGNHLIPPQYGPAAGALIGAYEADGLNVSLSNVPAEK
jgi:N-acetylglucosamine kinase-like BadF-type ATPase